MKFGIDNFFKQVKIFVKKYNSTGPFTGVSARESGWVGNILL
jgi:hypothetical protein